MERVKRSNRSNNYCCVPQCNSYYSAAMSFHRFPKDESLQDEWRRVLKIGKSISSYMQVCSKHFKKEDYFFSRVLTSRKHFLKRGTIPSCSLPKTSFEERTKENVSCTVVNEESSSNKDIGNTTDDGNHSIGSMRCRNCNETFSSEELLDCHARSCEISEALSASTQKNIEIKSDPDLDVGQTEVISESFVDTDNICFEFVGVTPKIEDSEFGNVQVKTEQEIDLHHGCSINDEFNYSTKCENCNKNISTNSSSLETTIEGVQTNNSVCVCINSTDSERKQQKCVICGYTTDYLSMLKRHIRIHTGEKPYHCSICDYSTKQPGCLTIHKRKHTGEKPYKCTMCHYTAARMGLIKAHMRTHTVREKPYKCSACDYATTSSANLKVHMRTHTGEKPYKCTRCDYASTQLSGLTLHMLKHTGKKPYKCDVCDYASVRMSNLKMHVRKHTGEKPYKCSMCAFAAAHMSSLKNHNQKHTGEKAYKCSNCDYAATESYNLKVHMKTHADENS